MIKEYHEIKLYGKSLFRRMIANPPFKLPLPMNEEACFLHIKKGNYLAYSADGSLKVNSQQSVLTKCGYYIQQVFATKNDEPFEALSVHFHPDVLKKLYKNNLPDFLTSDNEIIPSSMVLIDASTLVDKYVQDIIYYFEHPHLVNDDILSLKAKEIILLLMQTEDAPKIITILKNLFTQRTLQFKQVIENHLFSDISFEEFAQLLNMSLATFKRQFNAIYNCPPARYILLKRLERAKELLELTDQTVTSITFNCGFKTVSHFSRKFKEIYGIPPSQIRLNQTGN